MQDNALTVMTDATGILAVVLGGYWECDCSGQLLEGTRKWFRVADDHTC